MGVRSRVSLRSSALANFVQYRKGVLPNIRVASCGKADIVDSTYGPMQEWSRYKDVVLPERKYETVPG